MNEYAPLNNPGHINMRNLFTLGIITATMYGCGAGNTKPQYAMNPAQNYIVKEDGIYWSRFARLSQKQVELKIDSIDKETFTQLPNPLYAKDKNYVYYKASPIPHAEVTSFDVVTENFSKDSRHVFLKGELVKGADPETFAVLHEGLTDFYSKDKNNHFYGFTPFKPCDEKSFRLENDSLKYWATDSRCAFNRGLKLEGAQMESFTILDAGYAKDKQHVYHQEKQITSADSGSFTVKDGIGSDKKNCYKAGVIVDCESKKPKLLDLSPAEVNEAATAMAASWFREDQKKKSDAIAAIPTTTRDILKKYHGQYLTQADVAKIDLTKLPIGYVYSVKNTVPASINDYSPRTDAITYKVRNVTAETIGFDVIHPKNFGYLTETRFANGKKSSAPLIVSTPYSQEYFSPDNCEYQIGSCQFTRKIERSDTPQTLVQIGKYQDGVWSYHVKIDTGKTLVTTFVYDKNGLPLYLSSHVDDLLIYEYVRDE